MRCEQVLGAFERHALAALTRCRRPGALDETLFGEKAQDRLAIGPGLIDPGVAHAAKLKCGRQVGRWNGGFGESPGKA
ncbi:hypothetical protein D3C84_1017350 [compost metagenome]